MFPDEHVILGTVFLDFKCELEDVYKVYCQNHDDAINLLENYEKDENLHKLVLECLENLRLVRMDEALTCRSC